MAPDVPAPAASARPGRSRGGRGDRGRAAGHRRVLELGVGRRPGQRGAAERRGLRDGRPAPGRGGGRLREARARARGRRRRRSRPGAAQPRRRRPRPGGAELHARRRALGGLAAERVRHPVRARVRGGDRGLGRRSGSGAQDAGADGQAVRGAQRRGHRGHRSGRARGPTGGRERHLAGRVGSLHAGDRAARVAGRNGLHRCAQPRRRAAGVADRSAAAARPAAALRAHPGQADGDHHDRRRQPHRARLRQSAGRARPEQPDAGGRRRARHVAAADAAHLRAAGAVVAGARRPRGGPAAVRGAEPRGQPRAAQRPAAGVRAPLRAHDRPAADRGHRELDRRRGTVRVRHLAGRPDRRAGDRVAEPGPVGACAGVAAPVRGAAAGCFRCARPRGVRRARAAAAAWAGDRHRPRQPDRRRVRARSGRGRSTRR